MKRFKKSSITAISLLLLTLAMIVLGASFNFGPVNSNSSQGHLDKPTPVGMDISPDTREPANAGSEVQGKWFGLCRMNSIHSVEDFRRTVEADAVLAGHYAGFDFDNARIEKLDKPAMVYVAYRKKDNISYTTRMIKLPAGDMYITDGKRKVRMYCCNDFFDKFPVVPSTVDTLISPDLAPLPMPLDVPATPLNIAGDDFNSLFAKEGPLAGYDPGSERLYSGTGYTSDTTSMFGSPGNNGSLTDSAMSGGPGNFNTASGGNPTGDGAPFTPYFPPSPPAPEGGGTPPQPDHEKDTPSGNPPTGGGNPPTGGNNPGGPENPVTTVPEPSTLLLLATGMTGLIYSRKRFVSRQ